MIQKARIQNMSRNMYYRLVHIVDIYFLYKKKRMNKWHLIKYMIGTVVVAKIILFITILLLFITIFLCELSYRSNECETGEILGDLPTWLTAMVAIFSVIYAKKAFDKQSDAIVSQEKAARRVSFDTTFTQIFAQHSILYKKVQDSLTGHCCFAGFRTHFQTQVILANIKGTKTTNKEIWEKYNKSLEQQSGKKERTSNFRNYFKYIYIEVHYIEKEAEKAGLDKSTQKRYVRLIEGQMNNDELFCYFVNQLEYYENHRGNTERQQELIRYFRYLKDNNFFREICKESSGYQQDVIDALELFQQGIGRSSLVDDVYELLTRRNWFLSN